MAERNDGRPLYANLDGVPSQQPPADGAPYFYLSPMGGWSMGPVDHRLEIEDVCLRIHDKLAERIFGSLAQYYSVLPTTPEYLVTAGLNSESALSRADLERIVAKSQGGTTNKLLYLYDCRKLVSGIQECMNEIGQLQGEFYRGLNFDSLFEPAIETPDGLRYLSSPATARLLALLGFVLVRLHSVFDYATKLAYELEHLQAKFDAYPRLSSRSIQFSNRRKIRFDGEPGTIFQVSGAIKQIEVYRNFIIHDGLLDDQPKIYENRERGHVTERFVLFPDFGDSGQLERYGNRTLFFSKADKVNLRLPSLVLDVQKRLARTLERALSLAS